MQSLKPIINFRVGGGVLQLTLGIGIVISIICSSMILLAYFSKLIWIRNDIEDDLRRNAVSGFHYAIATRGALKFFQPQTVDLFSEGVDSVEVTRRPWGIYETCVTVASRGRHSYSKVALITGQPDELGLAALYTPENNSPLYLVGKTSLVGTAYLSERKFSNGYIDGKDYKRKAFITGSTKKSQSAMPVIDTVLLAELRSVFKNTTNSYHLNHIDFRPGQVSYSFQPQHTNYYFSEQSIDLTDSLDGNLIIHSAISVRILRQARISDIIVMAPSIEIDSGFEGTVQCFATRSITVGTGTILNYPSALILEGGGYTDSTIVIKKDARVKGVIIIGGLDGITGNKGLLKIEERGLFHGMAYVNGSSDVRGAVWGHITTRRFLTKIESSEYPDHILDGEINALKRTSYMPASLLWAKSQEIIVAKWLQ